MTVAYLASDAAFQAGQLAATLGIPAIGLTCLVIGLVQRSRNRPRPGPYPPPHQPPLGFPTNTGYPYPPGPPPPPMGYQGPYPAPPYPGYRPGFPPPRRAGKSATTLIIIGALLLTLGGVGILGKIAGIAARNVERPHGAGLLPTDTSMRVGECISQIDYLGRFFGSRPGNDCANGFDTYELAFKGGPSASCPDGKREHSVYDRYTDESTILCFALNLKRGECYQMDHEGDDLTMSLGECSDTKSPQVRVVQRIDRSTDKAQCPGGTKAIAYPVPARVYCLEKAGS